MPFKKGQPRPAGAGKRVGHKNKQPMPVPHVYTATAERSETEPIRGAITGKVADLSNERIEMILLGKLPCQTCHGEGETKYQAARGARYKLKRVCESCYGSKLEKLSPELIARVAMDTREYLYAKRKATEVSGPGGGAIEGHITLEVIDPSVTS